MNLPRLFRTLVHLKPCQIWYQVWRRVQRRLEPRPRCGNAELPELTFINLTARAKGWNDASLDMLWRYNLHYFDTAHELIPQWIRENPRGSAPGWDPYPTSLRIVNWVKLLTADGGGGVDDGGGVGSRRPTEDGGGRGAPALPEMMRKSLAEQVEWLAGHLEWHILANHLLANLKAMAVGTAYLEGERSRGTRDPTVGGTCVGAAGKWLKRYLAELDEQVLPDGGHYERSVMYHAIIFEDVLDVIEYCGAVATDPPSLRLRRARRDPPGRDGVPSPSALERLRPVAAKMLRYLVAMTGPDGRIALFNDAADGIAKPTAELVERASRMGVEAAEPSGGQRAAAFATLRRAKGCPLSQCVVDFPVTGYLRAEVGDWVLFADVAPLGPDYQPGHAHADTLTYELYYRGEKVVTDTGTSAYRGPNRAFERSTAAHNVVQVDGQDSSEVWSSHRVGRRAKVVRRQVSSGEGWVELEGAYVANGVQVARKWRLTSAGLSVEERVEEPRSDAARAASAELRRAREGACGTVVRTPLGAHKCTTRVHFAPGMENRVQVDFADARREEYLCALAFGRLEAAVCLAADFDPAANFCYTIAASK